MKKIIKMAFSLVELMVTLIVVACITAALTPVITKKLKSKEVIVGGGGNTNIEFAQDCSAFGSDCVLCVQDKCSLCTKECNSDEYARVADCVCVNCSEKVKNCIECSSKKCKKCTSGYGLSGDTCIKCEEGYYSNGEVACEVCPENYICTGITPVACASDQWASAGSTSCSSCNDILENCIKCNPRECLECKKGYKLKLIDDLYKCFLASGSKTYTSAGTYSFTVPEGVEEITVTLVSGGGGGAGGKTETVMQDFKSTTTWTIPLAARGNNVIFSSVGGGGGNAGMLNHAWYGTASVGSGGDGKAFKNKSFPMPNQETIKIVIGAAGKSASAIGNYGSGSVSGYKNVYVSDNECTGCGLIGASGWGGGATYFEGYANSTYMAAGGAGGNINSGARWPCSCTVTANGESGASGGGSTDDNIFTTSNVGFSRGHAAEAGAMRIIYNNWVNGGGGGGAGQIVPNAILSVSEGQNLTVIVGAGGAGGAVNASGGAGGQSKIIRDGEVLLITQGGATGGAPGGSGGSAGSITNGLTTSSIIVSGFSSSAGGSNFSTTGGSGGRTTINGSQAHCAGGSGAVVNVAGSDATSYGGCGGGGGGAGASGGAGAPGYVKISWGEE